MKRFIIAFLALLGLVAQAAPASAHRGGTETAQHGVVLGQSVQHQKLSVRQVVSRDGFAHQVPREIVSDGVRDGTFHTVPVATVNIGIDRARQ